MELKTAIERVENIYDQMARIAKMDNFSNNKAMKEDLEAIDILLTIAREKNVKED